MQDISAEEFLKLKTNDNNFQLLDVREKLEFHTFNIGGTNIPLGQLLQIIENAELEMGNLKPIIVICQHGLRSKTAKIILENAGFKNVKNLTGGLTKLQRIS